MRPEGKAGYVAGEHLEVNNAITLIDEAKTILEDQNVRDTMKANSYLGELSELGCYKQALEKAQNGLSILQKYHKDEDRHREVVDNINKKIEPTPEPEVMKIAEGIAIGEGVKKLEEEVKKAKEEPKEPIVEKREPIKKDVVPEFYSGVPGGEVIEPEDKPKKTKRKRSRTKKEVT